MVRKSCSLVGRSRSNHFSLLNLEQGVKLSVSENCWIFQLETCVLAWILPEVIFQYNYWNLAIGLGLFWRWIHSGFWYWAIQKLWKCWNLAISEIISMKQWNNFWTPSTWLGRALHSLLPLGSGKCRTVNIKTYSQRRLIISFWCGVHMQNISFLVFERDV